MLRLVDTTISGSALWVIHRYIVRIVFLSFVYLELRLRTSPNALIYLSGLITNVYAVYYAIVLRLFRPFPTQ